MQYQTQNNLGNQDYVPILIQPEDWMQSQFVLTAPTTQVPILIQPEDWMQYPVGNSGILPIRLVPILIQPEDWMQYNYPDVITDWNGVFQSSSSPKTGCNAGGAIAAPNGLVPILIQPEDWMQSQSKVETLYIQLLVPILIQPEDWMQFSDIEVTHINGIIVPILIQPEDWMQFDGCTGILSVTRRSNPHPARRLDAMSWQPTYVSFGYEVPILIQPEDWMQYKPRSDDNP